jgi:hypothetical protein
MLAMHQIVMVQGDDVYHLPEMVLRLSKTVRYCAVIDKSGSVIASNTRKNLQPLMTEQNGYRQALQAAMRHFTTPSWARNLGKMYYDVGRYEKVIGATIPITDKYLLLVAFDQDTDSFDRIIMTKILPIIKRISESGL